MVSSALKLPTTRIETLADGIFDITMTLLVLGIPVISSIVRFQHSHNGNSVLRNIYIRSKK